MEEKTVFSVYVLADDAGRVVAVGSDAFLTDTEGWVLIGEGTGDRYRHAQNNYLANTLADERGVYRFKLKDGQVVARTQEEMDADYVPPVVRPTAEERISALEAAMVER
jgi:hypothetical protein